MVATSSTPSPSCPAVTVTVCGVLQFEPVNASRFVRGVLSVSMVTSALLLVTSSVTRQSLPLAGVGSAVRRTVYVPTLAFVPPPTVGSSSSASVVRLKAMPGVGVTTTVPVVRSLLPVWAAAGTRTASVSTAVKLLSPVKDSVRVAEVVPMTPPDTCETVTFRMSVSSAKLDAVASLAKVAFASATVWVLSPSCAAVTVNVCGLFQAWVGLLESELNPRFDGDTVTSALLLVMLPSTAVHPVGGLSSTTVYVPRWALLVPGSSSRARLHRLSVTPGVGETASVPEVRSVLPECAAASTRTASVDAVLKP